MHDFFFMKKQIRGLIKIKAINYEYLILWASTEFLKKIVNK